MIGEYRALARSVLELRIHLWTRYWVNTISAVITFYLMFALLFFGGQSIVPRATGESAPALIIGFFVWMMAFGSFRDPSRGLMDDAQWGTLERLYMTPRGLDAVIILRTVYFLVYRLLLGLVLLAFMMVTTTTFLNIDLISIIPIALLTISNASAIGFAFGGLAIIYKRIENIFYIIQFLFIAALFAPSDPYVYNLLPLKLGFDLLTEILENGKQIWELSMLDLGTLVGVAVAYFVIGLLVLNYCLSVARARGVMDHY